VDAPEKFSVTAIMAARNEEDIIGLSIQHLVEQGVAVYLIDRGSTDGTVAEAERFVGKGLIGIERFPAESDASAEDAQHSTWGHLLERKQKLAQELDGDWFIHHDADEFRESPWPHLDLCQAIRRVEEAGYNAIDFVLEGAHQIIIGNRDFEYSSPDKYLRSIGEAMNLMVAILIGKYIPVDEEDANRMALRGRDHSRGHRRVGFGINENQRAGGAIVAIEIGEHEPDIRVARFGGFGLFQQFDRFDLPIGLGIAFSHGSHDIRIVGREHIGNFEIR